MHMKQVQRTSSKSISNFQQKSFNEALEICKIKKRLTYSAVNSIAFFDSNDRQKESMRLEENAKI